MSRRPLLLVASILLVAALLVAFFNVPQVDILMRQVLRAVVPQRVQDAVRPLRAPMVIGFSPEWEATEVPLQSPVTVTFLTPMSTQATEESVAIEPSVRGKFTWRGSTLVFTPSEDWPMDTVVTVSVGSNARSWLLRRMERGFAFSFTTLGPPSVVETNPPRGVGYVHYREQPRITFNRLMDRESVERRLSVKPQIANQQLVWEGEELSITGTLEPSTEYRLVIGQGARDSAYGMETAKDFGWSFVAVEHSPYVSIPRAQNEVMVAAGRPTAVELSLSNVSRIDADLYQLSVPTYVTMTHSSRQEGRQFSPEKPAIASWSIETHLTPDRDERRELHLDPLEPGVYYLTIGSPEAVTDSAILISSRTAITMKRAPEQALVWATSIDQGMPVSDLPVAIYDAQAGVITTGVTDEAGFFQAQLDEPVGSVYVVAEKDGDLAICSDGWDQGIEPWRFEDVLWNWNTSGDTYRAFLYTDCAAYEPGQELNFRGAFGVDEDGRYSQPGIGTMVDVIASDCRGEPIYQGELVISPYGTVHGSFPLNVDLAEGEYLLTAIVGGEQHQTSFRIDRYGKEPFDVEWLLDAAHYMSGDVISGTLAAEYDFGVPVKGATVDYTVYAAGNLERTAGASRELSACEPPGCWSYEEEIASGHGVTGDDGEFAVALRAGAGIEGVPQRLRLEATITDDAGQQKRASATAMVHGGEFRVDLLPERLALLTGERAVVVIRATDIVGEPVRDLHLFYDIQVSEWETVPGEAEEGGFFSSQEITSEVERSSVTTDGDGQATISFTPQQGGVYRVEAWGRDGQGRRVLGATELWVGDPDKWVAWRLSQHDRVSLIPGQTSYDPEETARVLIQSPYERAMGLVTVEGAGVFDRQVIELDSNSAMVEIPLKREYAPNVYVSVSLVPQDPSGGSYPGFKVGYAQLNVRSTEKQLRVELTPTQESYEPGDVADFTIRTHDHLNRPVSAEVSLRVTSKAEFSSGDGDGLDMVSAFYGRRPLGVRTAESLSIHAARQRLADDYGGGGRIGAQKPQGEPSNVAYWNPAIVTNGGGVGRASFQIPDGPGIWKAYATAITADYEMGVAEVEILVSQPLGLWATAPAFLYSGDSAVIRTFLENDTGDRMSVQLRVDSTDELSTSKSPVTVAVDPGGRATVDWPVQAERAGLANFTVSASGGEEQSESVQGTIAILSFGQHGRVSEAYVVERRGLQTVSVPGNAGPATMIMDVAPSLSSALVGSVEYLMSRVATSVEEIVSQFLPGLLLDQTAAEVLSSDDLALSGLPGLVESSLQRLYRLQNRDGGWGWVEGDQSQSYQTAYVVLGLGQARDAGYAVSERALQDGLEFLRKVSIETHDLNEKAYLSYVLSQCGEGDLSLARSLSERRRNMDLYAQGYLSLALSDMRDDASARSIVRDLVAAVVETAHTAHWTEDDHDLSRMSSDGRTTAVVLQALSSVDPDHPLLTKAVNWLMWERDGGFWRNSYETSAVVSALTAYLTVAGEAAGATGYEVYLDDAVVAESAAPPDGQAACPAQISAELSPGEHIIEAVSLGEAPLYLSTLVEYYALTGPVEAARSLNGPSVERTYELVSTGEPVNESGLGDLLRVRLRVEIPEDAWHVVLEDPLLPGAELVAVNPPVSSGSSTPQAGILAHTVGLEDRVGFFATWLPAGNEEFTYVIRATTAGEFKVMPAEMREVYEPGVWGRSASSSLKVIGRP